MSFDDFMRKREVTQSRRVTLRESAVQLNESVAVTLDEVAVVELASQLWDDHGPLDEATDEQIVGTLLSHKMCEGSFDRVYAKYKQYG